MSNQQDTNSPHPVMAVLNQHRADVEQSINLHRESGSSTAMAIAMVRLDTLDKLLADAEAAQADPRVRLPEPDDGYDDGLVNILLPKVSAEHRSYLATWEIRGAADE